MEEQADNNSSPTLITNYVRISEPAEPNTQPREDTPCPPNTKSDVESENSPDTPEPRLAASEILQTPDSTVDQGVNLSPSTHHKQYSPSNSPDICDLMYVRQQPREIVHHFWARFLLVKNKIKDCRDEDAISVFRNNCTDEGILNAIKPPLRITLC